MMIISAMPMLAAMARMPMTWVTVTSGIGELQSAVEAADHHDFRQGTEHLLGAQAGDLLVVDTPQHQPGGAAAGKRSEEHTSELQSLLRISYAVFCLTKK